MTPRRRGKRRPVKCDCHSILVDAKGRTIHYDDCNVIQVALSIF